MQGMERVNDTQSAKMDNRSDHTLRLPRLLLTQGAVQLQLSVLPYSTGSYGRSHRRPSKRH